MTSPSRVLRVVETLLRHRYPNRDVLTRRVGNVWSAEVVAPNQVRLPYRTSIVAEADTPEALLSKLQEL